MTHKRDKLLTIYGRKPAVEALESKKLTVVKVWIAENVQGAIIEKIIRLAKKSNVEIERASAQKVSQISRNGKQDQGVALDVLPPLFDSAESYFVSLEGWESPAMYMAFDRLTTPANLGMCIRAGIGAGVSGFILPRFGVSDLNPLVVKSSAGTVFDARILHCDRAENGVAAAKNAGFSVLGLSARAKNDLFHSPIPARVVWVLGGEREGYTPAVRKLTDMEISIPMAGNLESLNVATAGAIVAYEFYRRYFSRL